MSVVVAERTDYWSNFYSGKGSSSSLLPPSQFSAFVAQEIDPGSVIFDVGCGNGRDSLFFAALGFRVVAMDQSEVAIQAARTRAEERNLDNLHFASESITGPYLGEALADLETPSVCVYARFFLHAITESEQDAFLDTLTEKMRKGQKLALEYRTTADQFLEKHAPPHYRRYQTSRRVNSILQSLGFRLIYAAEGLGYAKYKDEDAMVARGLFERA